MTLNVTDIEALTGIVAAVTQFRKTAAVTQLLTPVNLSEERARVRESAARGVIIAPKFHFRPSHDRVAEATFAAGQVLRLATGLTDSWGEKIRSDIAQRMAALEAAVSHSSEDITAVTASTYGCVSADLRALAQEILSVPATAIEAPLLDAERAKSHFEAVLSNEAFAGWGVQISDQMHGRAAVLSAQRLLRLSQAARFSAQELDRLVVHELGTHALRAINASKQSLALLALPVGTAEPTEEGLALVNEAQFGLLETRDLRKYALRVIAAHESLSRPFTAVLEMLLEYTSVEEAVNIAIRAKRGFLDTEHAGAHLKDVSYLAGYLEVSEHLRTAPQDYGLLMSVKQPLTMLPLLKEVEAAGELRLWPAVTSSTGTRLPGPGLAIDHGMLVNLVRDPAAGDLTAAVAVAVAAASPRAGVAAPVWRLTKARTRKSGGEVAASIASLASETTAKPTQFRGLRVDGDIILDGMSFPAPIEFIDCEVMGSLSARNAAFAAVSFTNCRIGAVDLTDSQVHGSVSLETCQIGTGTGVAFAAVRAKVSGGWSAGLDAQGEPNRFAGQLDLELAEITGRVDLNGVEIEGAVKRMGTGKEELIALSLVRAKCHGGVRLRGARVHGMIRGIGLELQGQLNLTQTHVSNPRSRSLVLERARLGSSVLLRGASMQGRVSLSGTRVAGAILCGGLQIRDVEGAVALNFNSVHCQKLDFVENAASTLRASISGGVTLQLAEIEQDMNVEGLSVTAHGTALDMTGTVVRGKVCGQRMALTSVTNDATPGAALAAEALEVGGVLDLENSVFTGSVNLNNVRVGAFASLQHCRFEGTDAVLTFRGAKFSHDLVLQQLVFLFNATVRLSSAEVQGTLFWSGIVGDPEVDLESARVHELNDDEASWPSGSRLNLRGFSYTQFAQPLTDAATVRRRIAWLESQSSFTADPYERLAAHCREQINSGAANQVMLALKRAQIRQHPRVLRRWGKWLWYALTGYGYRLSGIIVVALCVLAVALGASFFAQQQGLVTPSAGEQARSQTTGELPSARDCTSEYPCFDPIVFGVDAVVPVIEFHQAQYWVPDRSTVRGYAFDKLLQLCTALGWITLTVAAGGIIQRMRA